MRWVFNSANIRLLSLTTCSLYSSAALTIVWTATISTMPKSAIMARTNKSANTMAIGLGTRQRTTWKSMTGATTVVMKIASTNGIITLRV